ncbi:hypothetical protein ACP70R_027111 [Stipagrostis hirtigluma subsp. patula]
MPYEDEPAAAAPPPPAAASSPEPRRWTRRDDKLLQMLVFVRSSWTHVASCLAGRTPDQACDRYNRMVDELRHVLFSPGVETPREWDVEIVVAPAAPAVAEEAGEPAAPLAIVPATPVVAVEDPAGPTTPAGGGGGGGGDRSEEGQKRKMRKSGGKRKKPVMWTEEEHKLFLAGLEKYGKGKWKAMSAEYLTTKSASQIASHHQKYRNRKEQRDRNGCKRASIHDITEHTAATAGAAAAAAVGGEPARVDDDDPAARAGRLDDGAPPGEDECGPDDGKKAEEPIGGDELGGGPEQFAGEGDPGTLLT